MARKPKIDAAEVKRTAEGRWREILENVAGIGRDILDAQHHPCPQCGGEDRFRLIDEAAGAVMCNQCFAEKNGDGLAAVGWMKSLKFTEATKLVAEYLGMATAATKDDPAKDLEWMPWASALALRFVVAKPGVTEESLLMNGARMARYKQRYTVIALPIIGQELDAARPVGWAIYNHSGAKLPKWDKKGNETGQVPVKITWGSEPGFVGKHACERLKAMLGGDSAGAPIELAWKVEGITDMLAVFAAVPAELRDRHLVLTNSNGARETPRERATLLAGINVNVIHDADEPGQEGAEKWAAAIAGQQADGVTCKNVTLPYPISPDHGKDVRDWLASGNDYEGLLSLAGGAAATKVARTASGEIDYSTATNPTLDRLLKKLQLEVLYEDEAGGIRVFSLLLRKSSWVKNIDRLKHDSLIQIAGTPAIVHIVTSEKDASDDLWTMNDVRRALSLSAATRRGKNDERGIGVWQGIDVAGNETPTVVLVGNTEGCRWNGDKVLRRILAPRADGLVLDFGAAGKDWYDFAGLEKMLASAADVAWRQAAVAETVELFSRWRWRNQEIDPTLLAGLILASWVQTIWDWRPLVAISGESNSGKSFLFECLGGSQSRRGVFGALAFKQAKSTAAGIMQGLGNTARVALCDEFEASRERTKILEAFRQSSRGEATAKGTAHHRGVEFTLRHIGWVAAIETGLQKQPDANRFIQFELLTAAAGEHGKLRLPEPAWIADLGQRLLAVAIWSAIASKRLAVVLKDTPATGIDPRTVESYGVPAAMLAVAEGLDEEQARTLLLSLLVGVDQAEQGRVDQQELLSDILTASIHLDGRKGVMTVGQVLESVTLRAEYAARLEASGVRLLEDYSLFLAPKIVSSQLLSRGPWEGQKLDQILLRLPKARRHTLRVGGTPVRGIVIPDSTINPPQEAVFANGELDNV